MTATSNRVSPGEAYLAPVLEAAPSASRQLPSRFLRRLLVALDAASAATAWLVAFLVTDGLQSSHGAGPAVLPMTAALLTALTVALLASHHLYLARVCSIRAVELARLGRTALLSGLAALLLPRALPVELATDAAVAGAGLSFAVLMFVRGIYRHWLHVGRRDGRFLRPVVIIGSNDEGYGLYKLLNDHPELGFRAVGVVGERADMVAFGSVVPYLGPLDGAEAAVAGSGANGVLVAASAVPSARLNVIIRSLLRSGVHVHLSSGLRGFDRRRLRAQPLAHEPLFYVEPSRLAPWQVAWKRIIDVGVAAVGGVVLALPVLLLSAVAIKLEDRGPILYRQRRVGRGGRDFTIFKLRTMVPKADTMYEGLALTRAGRDGPLIKLVADPRRTRVGRFLERLSIDELPQLWNVLTGDMSLVGPRPAQRAEVACFDEELLSRLSVRPGITGLWQVEARDNPSFAAYKRFDLFYLENWSIALDLAILVATVQRVAFRGLELIFSRKAEMGGLQRAVAPVELDLRDEVLIPVPAPGAIGVRAVLGDRC